MSSSVIGWSSEGMDIVMPSATLVFTNLDGEKAKRAIMAKDKKNFLIRNLKNEMDGRLCITSTFINLRAQI
jgi:hypothetical protein